jgi:tetratricopeptide (TPR) repeat protein
MLNGLSLFLSLLSLKAQEVTLMKHTLFHWILTSLVSYSVMAQPYRPTTDAEILETLPIQSQNWLETRQLRENSLANPNDMQQAVTLVRHYIELGRAESDPRYYGYAEAALSPWLQKQTTPEVLTLRATLYQNRHEFPAALDLLNQAIRQQPRLAGAWLTRAQILEVQGDYAAALNSCKPLLRLSVPLTAAVCSNAILSLSGQLLPAYQRLYQFVQVAGAENPADQQWAWVTLAEMAERLGDTTKAEAHYQTALQLVARNGYLLATYSDFLLDQKRYNEVIKLLQKETRHDGLLLRLTLAEQPLQLPTTSEHIETLKLRFAASRLRGDTSHQAEEARFVLQLLQQPAAALALAQSNWAVQRESRDARILLEAALADGRNQNAAQPIFDFINQNQLQDVRLQALIDQFKGKSA